MLGARDAGFLVEYTSWSTGKADRNQINCTEFQLWKMVQRAYKWRSDQVRKVNQASLRKPLTLPQRSGGHVFIKATQREN